MKELLESHIIAGEFLGVQYSQWVHIGITLLIAIAIYFILKALIKVCDVFLFAKNSLSYEITSSLSGPIAVFLATLYIKLSENFIGLSGSSEKIWHASTSFIFSGAAFWSLYCLVTPLTVALSKAASKTQSDLDDQLVPLISKTSRIVIVILAVLTMIQSLGVNVFSLIAGLGIGGLAIALAAKDTAANFFGSLMILFDQPFKAGDWIRLDNIEGTVTDIGFRSTRIKTFYDSEVVIPNSTVANSNIDNMGKRQYRRVYTTLGVTYSTSSEQIKLFAQGISKIISEHPQTRKDKFHVNFNSMGESSLNILLYFFLEVSSYQDELAAREDIFLQIIKLSKELHVEFAFPSQSIYLENTVKTQNI